ncbi:hypothetical protein LNP74_19555 [Klebsiella pneumoniae subsp. pneumoniae]|nr:hypothetical protein [Klebsiella pneumoniae subsp. pneumoniae]
MLQALPKGGSFGIYGDFLFQTIRNTDRVLARHLAGLYLGLIEQLSKTVLTNSAESDSW